MYVECFPLWWIWLTQGASQASLLLPEREKASWAQLLVNDLLSFYLSSLPHLMRLPHPVEPPIYLQAWGWLTEWLIMPHWTLKHFNNQVGGQGPGGAGQPNEAFVLNKSSNALCQGRAGWPGQSWDHLANCITRQEAGRGQKELKGALFRDQGTTSELELMDFWAATCRGSRSNKNLFWLGQQLGLWFYQKILHDQGQNGIMSWP